jgi:hypothetical protein
MKHLKLSKALFLLVLWHAFNESDYATYFDDCAQPNRTEAESVQLTDAAPVYLNPRQILRFIQKFFNYFKQTSFEYCNELGSQG